MHVRRPLAAAAIALLAAAGVGVATGTASAAPGDSPRATYIVTVAPGTAPAGVAQRARGLGGEVEHVYTAALNGFAISIPSAAAGNLGRLPGVVAVEADQPVQAQEIQDNATWGLDRIDQRIVDNNTPLDGIYTYANTGAGVTAYVIDSGIRTDHTEFSGRIRPGHDVIDGGTADDCNGHGTHVAGTIGGTNHGVAKGVTLVPVRVLGCNGSGTTSGVIAGIDWVTTNAVTPAVANMSLGGGTSTALDAAVRKSVAAGITYAVAAGNGNSAGVPQDACKSSPARVGEALTVAASDSADAPAPWSNYGKCVDLFAPGVGITSAWHTAAAATNTISGTSMATPHVAGVAALHLQSTPKASPAAIGSAIRAEVTKDVVRTNRTANNDLLFTFTNDL